MKRNELLNILKPAEKWHSNPAVSFQAYVAAMEHLYIELWVNLSTAAKYIHNDKLK